MLQLSIFFQKNSKAVLVFVSYVICLRCDVNTNYEGVVLTFFFSSFNSISIICSRLNLNSHIYVVCPMLCWVLLCVLYPNSKKKRFCYGFAVLLLYCRSLSFLVAICSWHIVWLFSLGELHYITAQNALSWHDEKNCIIYLKKKSKSIWIQKKRRNAFYTLLLHYNWVSYKGHMFFHTYFIVRGRPNTPSKFKLFALFFCSNVSLVVCVGLRWWWWCLLLRVFFRSVVAFLCIIHNPQCK